MREVALAVTHPGARVAVALATEMEPSLGSSAKQVPPRPASPGQQVTLDEFEVLDGDAGRSLGKGSFGVVRRIRRKGTGDEYALKTMQKIEVIEGDLIDQVEREIQVQRNLKHENVLRLYKHFEDADTVYLLLEYCAKGELYQLLRTRKGRRFSEEVAQHYFVQVTRGLRYLHSQSIVHRDLKPENLLVTADDVLKIADFGWCADSSGTRTTFCGTLDYLAPEMIQGRGHNHTLDIWSLGVLLYEMVVGRPPFQSTNHVMLISKILEMQLRFPAFVPQGVRNLVERLLQKEPSERLALDQVLRHYWVVSTVGARPTLVNGQPVREASPPPGEAVPPMRQPLQPAVACRAVSASLDEAVARKQQQQQPLPMPQPQVLAQISPRDNGSGGNANADSAGSHVGSAGMSHTGSAGVSHAGSAGVSLAGSAGVSHAGSVGVTVHQPQAPSAVAVPVPSCATASRAVPGASVVAQPPVRSQPPSTPSAPGCRALAAPPTSTRVVARHNLSAPQTPVQQAPFRGVCTAASTATMVVGTGCSSLTAVSTAPYASVVDGRSPQMMNGRRKSRRESPGAAVATTQSPARRPRSSGPPQPHLPTRGVRTDLASSGAGASQGISAIVCPAALNGSTPASAALPAQPQQQRLAPRVAVNGYPSPGSPKPCTAGRSLSPVGPTMAATTASTTTGLSTTVPVSSSYLGKARAIPSGMAVVRRAQA